LKPNCVLATLWRPDDSEERRAGLNGAELQASVGNWKSISSGGRYTYQRRGRFSSRKPASQNHFTAPYRLIRVKDKPFAGLASCLRVEKYNRFPVPPATIVISY
jgi:hypothetical protein